MPYRIVLGRPLHPAGAAVLAARADVETVEMFDPPAPANDYPDSWGLDAGGRFARACLGLEAPFCPAEEGKKSLDLVLAMEKAALTGKTVKLK